MPTHGNRSSLSWGICLVRRVVRVTTRRSSRYCKVCAIHRQTMHNGSGFPWCSLNGLPPSSRQRARQPITVAATGVGSPVPSVTLPACNRAVEARRWAVKHSGADSHDDADERVRARCLPCSLTMPITALEPSWRDPVPPRSRRVQPDSAAMSLLRMARCNALPITGIKALIPSPKGHVCQPGQLSVRRERGA